jgi:hypothetical protein
MEIGDTVCNVNSYYRIGEIKGYITKITINDNFEGDRVHLIRTNIRMYYQSYLGHFANSRVVLLEKYNPKFE